MTITAKYSGILQTSAGSLKILSLDDIKANFIQSGTCTRAGVAVYPYGIVLIPMVLSYESYILEAEKDGIRCYATKLEVDTLDIGDTLIMTDSNPEGDDILPSGLDDNKPILPNRPI